MQFWFRDLICQFHSVQIYEVSNCLKDLQKSHYFYDWYLFFPSISSRIWGWRYGLQLLALVLFGPFFAGNPNWIHLWRYYFLKNIKFIFFLGTFYRSATLYHPQRRAILHLKTQQRKLLEKMPVAKITPFKDLKAVQNWSLQFALLAAFLSAIGLYSPMVNMVTMQ